MEAGKRPARDPHLGAIEDEAVAVGARSRRERGGVRATSGLAERKACRSELALGVRAEPPLLLRGGGVVGEHLRRQVARREDDRGRCAPPPRSLPSRARTRRCPCRRRQQAELGELVELLEREAPGAIALGRARRKPSRRKVAGRLRDQPLLLTERESEPIQDPCALDHRVTFRETSARDRIRPNAGRLESIRVSKSTGSLSFCRMPALGSAVASASARGLVTFPPRQGDQEVRGCTGCARSSFDGGPSAMRVIASVARAPRARGRAGVREETPALRGRDDSVRCPCPRAAW